VSIVVINGMSDIVLARNLARKEARSLGFSLLGVTRIATAVSELARNTLIHGGGGLMELTLVTHGHRTGLRFTFVDDGAGIADIALALQDGYTSAGGLGLGLSGSKRLMDDMKIESSPSTGTRVTVCKWR